MISIVTADHCGTPQSKHARYKCPAAVVSPISIKWIHKTANDIFP